MEPLQNKRRSGRATKRVARELAGAGRGTTDLGNEFATLDRELPDEAVHRTKRPEDRNAMAVVDRGIQTLKKDLATRVARRGGQWSDHFKQAALAYNVRPHEGGRRETAGHRVQGAARQRRQVPAQQGLDEPAHEDHRGRRGVSGAYQRGEELQPPVRQRAAAAGRGLHDRPEHRRPGDPAEAGAAGAPGQQQRSGAADEAGQTGCGEAAGRLPGGQAAQKRFGPLTFLSRLDGSNMP